MSKKGVTILEVCLVIIVLSILAIVLGNIFFVSQSAFTKQRTKARLLNESRWAMEFMVKELRQSTLTGTPGWARVNIMGGDTVDFGIDSDFDGSADMRIRYLLSGTNLLRRSRIVGPWEEAELATNASNVNFSLSGSVITIQLTLINDSISYTLRGAARIRN